MRFVRIQGGLLAAVVAVLLGSEVALAQQPPSWSELRRRIRLELEGVSGTSTLIQVEVRAPSPREIQWSGEPAGTLDETVQQLACEQNFPPDLLLGVLEVESGLQQDVIGAVGEIGASQIRPETADIHGLSRERLLDAEYNIRGGILILRSCGVEVDLEQGLRCYNGGPNWQRSPWHVQQKLRSYVRRVLAARARYRHVRCD